MSLKDLATSINSRLSNLAQKQGVSFQNISTSFLIERLVARFTSDKELASALVFKGGYVSLRVYNSSRFTIDLDAWLLYANIRVTLEKTKLIAAKDLGDGVWFRFEQEIDLKTQGEYGGIRQSFRGGIGIPLKDLKRAQIINFDLGIGDPVTPFPIKKEMPELLGGGGQNGNLVFGDFLEKFKRVWQTRGVVFRLKLIIATLRIFLPRWDAR